MIEGLMGSVFGGMKVFSSPHLPRFKVVQFRFPKSKRRRIRKKFAKDKNNFKQVPFNAGFVFNGTDIVVHPDDLNRLRQLIR